jgi:hypothetical protein
LPKPKRRSGGETEAASIERYKAVTDIQSDSDQNKCLDDQLVADLAVIADWRDDLLSRIQRADLRFEFIGLDAGELEALAAETATFTQVCIALAGSLVGLDD